MASVVKRLRPRIVVPICVGSNPTRRPIKNVLAFAKTFFIWVCEGEKQLKCESILWSSSASRAKAEAVGEIVKRSARQMSRRGSRLTRGAARQSHQTPHNKNKHPKWVHFLFVWLGWEPYQAKLGLGSSASRAKAEGLLQKERKFLNAKSVMPFNASDSRQSHCSKTISLTEVVSLIIFSKVPSL